MMHSLKYHEKQYAVRRRSNLISRVRKVVAVSHELLSKNVIDVDTFSSFLRMFATGTLLFMLMPLLGSDRNTVVNLVKGPQRFTQIVGFSERGVQEYFQKFFQDEWKTYEIVKTNETLLTACSVPLLCWMVCFCLKKCSKDDHVMKGLKTTTSIFVHFVSALLEGRSLSVLRSLAQLAEGGVLDEDGVFDESMVFETGFYAECSRFLHTKLCLRDSVRKTVKMKFMHDSFQEFFMALNYAFLNEEQFQMNIRDTLAMKKVKGGLSNPISSVLLFLYGLSNENTSCYTTEQKYNLTVFDAMRKEMESTILTLLDEDTILALRCLHELQDEEFTRRALADWKSLALSDVPLRSTDCWVLLYCLQLCPQIRDLKLMYCELTAEKLKILQPALSVCETLRLSVDQLFTVGDLIKAFYEFNILKELKVQEDEYSAKRPRWSLDLTANQGNFRVSLSSSVKNSSSPGVFYISFTCHQSQIYSTDWTLFLQRLCRSGKLAEPLMLCRSVKTMGLNVFSLNESCAAEIISIVQICTSLEQLSVSVTGLLLEGGLKLLNESLTDPHCTVSIEGRKCGKPTDQCREQDWSHSCNEKVKIHFEPKALEELKKLNISESEASDLNLHPLPVCQSCVHIADSDQWIEMKPSVCRDEGGSEFRICTPAGRFECSRTRMRWVCKEDVTLHYHAVDGCFLSAELERLQCERIGPVIDVTVISGKLEEAHLPHYACLGESDPSLKDAVKFLSKRDEGISLQSVELTRFHAKIIQPSFSLTTLIINWFMKWEEHHNLLLFMRRKDPLILHVYFFPVNDTFLEEKVEQNENSSLLIRPPRPNRPFRMKTPHLLEVPDATLHPIEGISFRNDVVPNFFKVRQHEDRDVEMNLIREEDKQSVWKTTIWKEAQIVDQNYALLVQRVSLVLPLADELKKKRMIHEEKYAQIKAEQTEQDKMRKLFEALHSGGDRVKKHFYDVLKEQEPDLFKELT